MGSNDPAVGSFTFRRVGELRMMLDGGLLNKNLQHDMTFIMIVKAFESYDGILDLEPDNSLQTTTNALTKQQTRSPSELPPPKSFGAFISHKKVTAHCNIYI